MNVMTNASFKFGNESVEPTEPTGHKSKGRVLGPRKRGELSALVGGLGLTRKL